MLVREKFYRLLRKKISEKPEKAGIYLRTGLYMADVAGRAGLFFHQNSSGYLSNIAIRSVLNPLIHTKKAVWSNIFSPTEITQSLGMHPLFTEAFASFMTGMHCETSLMAAAGNIGASDTLCSFHKVFAGAVETRLLQNPAAALISCTACDANTLVFSNLTSARKIPFIHIDVPYNYSQEAEKYTMAQLEDAILKLEDIAGKHLDMNILRAIVARENSTRCLMRDTLSQLAVKEFHNSMTQEMNQLIASHTMMGSRESLKYYTMRSKELDIAARTEKKRIFWVHVLPFCQPALVSMFNDTNSFQLIGKDFEYDYPEMMDEADPLRAIAKKMILNRFNGPFQRRQENIIKLVKQMRPDAVICFCHWGCRQSNGGISLLEKALSSMGIPVLVIDGDAIDDSKNHSGQIKTRMEAFHEMLQSNEREIKMS